MSEISVIIPTYNQARYLGAAIESALAQTHRPREVIVIDDGSRDETPEVLAQFGRGVQAVRQSNRGVAAARNAGARIAMGEFLAFLDSDDRWLPRKLERQMEAIRAAPGLGLVHCGVAEVDAGGAHLRDLLNGLDGWVADEMLLFRRAVILGGGSGILIPRAIFEVVGGFDEQLSTSADWDLYYRIATRHHVGFIPEVLLEYRLHGANMHGNMRAMEHDMLLAYAKAFAEAVPRPRVSRRRAYGNLHTALAGGFFAAGDYWRFAAHAMKSLLLAPDNIAHYLSYPLRRWRRGSAEAAA